jgi:Na+-translocating ferredoxin:NAD+ oxidoreductase RnfE subunit
MIASPIIALSWIIEALPSGMFKSIGSWIIFIIISCIAIKCTISIFTNKKGK